MKDISLIVIFHDDVNLLAYLEYTNQDEEPIIIAWCEMLRENIMKHVTDGTLWYDERIHGKYEGRQLITVNEV